MGRIPRCSKDGLNKGAWTALEDKILIDHVKTHGEGKWSNLAKETGERVHSFQFSFPGCINNFKVQLVCVCVFVSLYQCVSI